MNKHLVHSCLSTIDPYFTPNLPGVNPCLRKNEKKVHFPSTGLPARKKPHAPGRGNTPQSTPPPEGTQENFVARCPLVSVRVWGQGLLRANRTTCGRMFSHTPPPLTSSLRPPASSLSRGGRHDVRSKEASSAIDSMVRLRLHPGRSVFCDHNEKSLSRIRQYIAANPASWTWDRENPQAQSNPPAEPQW